MLIGISGFFATQRYIGIPISNYFFILPVLLSIFFYLESEIDKAMSCFILALFFAVDNGAGIYLETHYIALNCLYFVSIIVFLLSFDFKISNKKIFYLLFFLFIVLVGSSRNIILNDYYFDLGIFKRDILLIIIFSISVLKPKKRKYSLHLIYIGSLGYLLGEIVNIIFFYDRIIEAYLNFDTTKCFVLFPCFYLYTNRSINNFYKGILFCSVSVVFLFYGSRMVILSSIFLFLLIGLRILFSSKKKGIYILMTIVLLNFSVRSILGTKLDEVESIRSASFIALFFKNYEKESLSENLSLLDPVRYNEYKLYFSRSWFDLFFGSGPGSGIFDKNGLFSFVSPYQTAFSDNELGSNVFFNFHDIWIEIAIRFGFVVVLFIFFYFSFWEIFFGSKPKGFLFGMLLINSTFSTLGILFTTLIIRFFPKKV